MNTSHGEVGISIIPENNSATKVSPLVITQNFGSKSGNPFLLGVVYKDANKNKFYDPGEGLSLVMMDAKRSDGKSFSTIPFYISIPMW
jgi:hypothetical protein